MQNWVILGALTHSLVSFGFPLTMESYIWCECQDSNLELFLLDWATNHVFLCKYGVCLFCCAFLRSVVHKEPVRYSLHQ